MMKKVAGAAAALALFVVGTMLLVGYVRDAEDRVVANELPVEVLVVDQPVEVGSPPSTRIERVPARLALDDAVRPVDSLEGLVASVRLEPGEQLLWSRLGEPEEVEALESSRVEIPAGLLAVTVPVSADRALGGLLVPGMRVGVLGSFQIELEQVGEETQATQATNVLVHKALVVEVQSTAPIDSGLAEGAGSPPPPEGDVFVTLAVPVYDIERIVFAAEWGSIWLAEEGEDADTDGSRIQTPATIFDDPSLDDDRSDLLTDSSITIAPRGADRDPSTVGNDGAANADAPALADTEPGEAP